MFSTESGLSVPAVTAAQMRAVDLMATEGAGPNLYQMMENAGRNLALTVLDSLGAAWAEVPICVLAGTGGNGGGGICAARHLANRGADVTVVISKPEDVRPVTRQQLAVYMDAGGRVGQPSELGTLDVGLIVDALVGYQLTGPLGGVIRELVEWTADQDGPVLSLDVPSGVDATTGESCGPVVHATKTMTLALPKTGLSVPAVGALMLADIGITAGVYERVGISVPGELFGTAYRISLRYL